MCQEQKLVLTVIPCFNQSTTKTLECFFIEHVRLEISHLRNTVQSLRETTSRMSCDRGAVVPDTSHIIFMLRTQLSWHWHQCRPGLSAPFHHAFLLFQESFVTVRFTDSTGIREFMVTGATITIVLFLHMNQNILLFWLTLVNEALNGKTLTGCSTLSNNESVLKFPLKHKAPSHFVWVLRNLI